MDHYENYVPVFGYACRFGALDLAGDIIERGAFADSLSRRTPLQIKMLYQHHPDRPVGIWSDLYEDERGLAVRGYVFADTRDGRDAQALVRGGAITGLSVGFFAEESFRTEEGFRLLTRMDLREISLVTFPVQEFSLIRTAGEGV